MALYKFVKNIYAGNFINIYNKGRHARDFTYIDDAVDAILKIQKKIPNKKNTSFKTKDPSESFAPFRIVNIGSSKTVNLISYIKKIEKIIQKKANKKFLNLQKGDILRTHADISKIKREINFKHKTDIYKGLFKFISWYRKYK